MNRGDAQTAVSELVEEVVREELGLSYEDAEAVEQHIMARRDYPLLYLAPAIQEARHATDTLLDERHRDDGLAVMEAEEDLKAVAKKLIVEAVEATDEVDA